MVSMASKKPLLPPGSKWANSEKSSNKPLDEQLHEKVTPKLLTSTSSDDLIILTSNGHPHRKPLTRTSTDNCLSHDTTRSPNPLLRENVVHGTNEDSSKLGVALRSATVFKKPSPPQRPKFAAQSSNVSPKPSIAPRRSHTKVELNTSTAEASQKPRVPRKPRTVYAVNRTGPGVSRKAYPDTSKPSELPVATELLRKQNSVQTRTLHPRVLPSVNSAGKDKAVLERHLVTRNIRANAGCFDQVPTGNDRPTSMIITSQIALDEEDYHLQFSTIPRAKPSRDSKKATMTTTMTHEKANKRRGLFQKLKKVLQISENVSSSSSEEEEVNGESEEDLDNKGGTIKSRPMLRHVSVKEFERKRASMIDAADPSHEYRHLFEFVLVVGLRQVDTNGGKYEPYVTYRFPPASKQELAKDRSVQEIPNFCFPDINMITPLTDYSSETFSFVLTDVDGNRRFGYCRRLLPSGSGPRLPEVYCIVSVLGCFSMYEKILDNLEERRKASPSAAFTLLKAIIANPFPAPGKSIEVSAFNVKGDGMQVIKFTRPLDSRLEHVDFSVLFSCLDIKHIIQLFSALLMERRIIFCAEKLSTFSSCCHAATSLLYPCDWQHIFIPVLPNKLIDFCCSPLPYILGILPQNLPLLDDMDMEEAYIIHLDKGKVLNKIGDESMILPAKAKAYLEEHLVVIMEQWEQQGILDSSAISDTFLTFFAYIFGNYSQFMEVKDHVTNEKSFKTEKYIKSFSSEAVRRFLDAFQNTQMFDVFIQQRDTPALYSSVANGYFEKSLTKLRDRSKDIDMMNTGYSLAAKWKKFVTKKFKTTHH